MAPLASIRSRIARFTHIGRRGAMLFEAAGFLLLARLCLIFIPFSRLARHFGNFVAPNDPRALAAKSADSRDHAWLAKEIGWAVTRAACHVPFKAVCLPQAMAARIMLERRGVGSVLHFGAAIGKEKPIDTHAWLDAAGVKVIGYPVAESFAEIGCFVRQ